MNKQIAEAMERGTKLPAQSPAKVIESDTSGLLARPQKRSASSIRGDVMFGSAPKRKVLCACGAIAEVDSGMASTKRGLGKSVECRSCRNQRIAREKEELDVHFSGLDESEGP